VFSVGLADCQFVELGFALPVLVSYCFCIPFIVASFASWENADVVLKLGFPNFPPSSGCVFVSSVGSFFFPFLFQIRKTVSFFGLSFFPPNCCPPPAVPLRRFFQTVPPLAPKTILFEPPLDSSVLKRFILRLSLPPPHSPCF